MADPEPSCQDPNESEESTSSASSSASTSPSSSDGKCREIRPLMSVRPVLPPEVREMIAFRFGPPSHLQLRPLMFPGPGLCLPGPRHDFMRRGPQICPYPPPHWRFFDFHPPYLRPADNVRKHFFRSGKYDVGGRRITHAEEKKASKGDGETEKPWVNEAIIAEILLKHKLQQVARKSRSMKDWSAYREQRNKVTAMLRAAKLDWMTKEEKSADGEVPADLEKANNSAGTTTLEPEVNPDEPAELEEKTAVPAAENGTDSADLVDAVN